MKNNILRYLAIIILLSVFALLLIGISFSVSPSLEPLSPISTAISSSEEFSTNNIKMRISFEDKLSMIHIHYNKELNTTENLKRYTILSTTEKVVDNTVEEYPIVTMIETKNNQELETEKIIEEEVTTEKNYYSDRYEAASIIWTYLKNLGYNNYVCAGIMGNIMSECGGHTLDIEWWLYDDGYYGICQWSCFYHSNIENSSLDYQLDYLASTIKSEMNIFGYKFYDGFGYNSFLNLTDIEDAAIAFAACYERCATWSYDSRINNAYKAYNYFCG